LYKLFIKISLNSKRANIDYLEKTQPIFHYKFQRFINKIGAFFG